jgi:putative phosphonate metabolism protein
MENFQRYAIYYAPPEGGFADAAAAWLGWDLARGCAVVQPNPVPDFAALTADPRKYGFHGTIKPPFRLANGARVADLAQGVADLAAVRAPARLDGLALVQLDGFLAFTPLGDTAALSDLAARVVKGLEAFRAPLTPAEIARRRPETLTDRQRELLGMYGYPYVMEQFQFHLTLSGRLREGDMAAMHAAALVHFDGLAPAPFAVEDLCLCGEDAAGRFHLIQRYPLMA